ncbi:MAG: DUF4838 domain-containing protein [Bacteroidaceae bacterium]
MNIGCASTTPESFASKNGYVVLLPIGSKQEEARWAKYLFSHLQKRAMKPQYVEYMTTESDLFGLGIQLVPQQTSDFEVERDGATVWLRAKNESNLIWLMYQLMKQISREDPRISADDLPPSLLTFVDTCGTMPFEYREMYTPENLVPDMAPIYGNNCVDVDWGLWGHNLRKVLVDASNRAYATVDGELNKSQICFSSPDTYNALEQFVIDEYGEGQKSPSRFSIFPEDNELVCTCAECTKLGNTSSNATPAVSHLITRLAKRFPKHQFFTSSYLSTEKAPTETLPDNVGVLVGAMDLPLRANLEELPKSQKFIKRVKDWEKVVHRIYVWDYISNFDDYLTPFPVLRLVQERLQLYHKIGVNGVFLNGSGYDASTFSALHTFALSALLKNPSYSVDALVSTYFKHYYPLSAQALTSYYLSLEEQAFQRGKRLNLYGGIVDAERTHLDVPSFVAFYTSLSHWIAKTKGDERARLLRLQASLAFTRLEVARHAATGPFGCATQQGDRVLVRPEMKQLLSLLPKDSLSTHYSEAGAELSGYVREWERYLLPASLPNGLLAKRLTAKSSLDEEYTDLRVLTDGIHGLPSSYHAGWLICSAPTLQLDLPPLPDNEEKRLRLTFLHDPSHRLSAPKCVEVLRKGEVFATLPLSTPHVGLEAQQVEAVGKIKGLRGEVLTLRVVAEGKNKKIACDEVQLNP